MTELALAKSPSGYNWGYNGSGPSALAHSILADLMNEEFADEHFQNFKEKVIGRLDQGRSWKMEEMDIRRWIQIVTSSSPPSRRRQIH